MTVSPTLRLLKHLAWAAIFGVAPAFAQSPAPPPAQAAAVAVTPATTMAAAAANAAPAALAAADMAPRVRACTLCHGKEGRATPEGYFPRIAGKPTGYLANQLFNFRDGRRNYAPMSHLLETLSDAYLHEIAAYFAALQLPYPPPPAPQAAPAQLALGQRLVQQGDAARRLPACVQCHGSAMTGVAPAIPGLLGLPRDYLNSQLGAWQTGQRHAQAPDCMAEVAHKLSPDEVSAISAWLAAQPVPAHGKPAAQLPAPLPLRCGGVALPAAAERGRT